MVAGEVAVFWDVMLCSIEFWRNVYLILRVNE
jgi:hypothetical protein